MREIRLLAGVVLVCAWGAPAVAQSSLEGPLASPDSKPSAAPAPKKAAHHKPRKTAHAADKASPAAAAAASPSQAQPVVAPPPGTPINDPVSFGMKWNGSNDDARATRVQNYNGDAAGTGAEVGMKLHF